MQSIFSLAARRVPVRSYSLFSSPPFRLAWRTGPPLGLFRSPASASAAFGAYFSLSLFHLFAGIAHTSVEEILTGVILAFLFPVRQGPRILQRSDASGLPEASSEMRQSAPSRSALPVIGWLFLLRVYGSKGSSGLLGGPPGVGLSAGIFWEAGVKLGVSSEFLYFGALTYPCT